MIPKYPIHPVKNKKLLISTIHGLNPSGGFPSGTVQFSFPYRTVVEALLRRVLRGNK
jgi:hypothetical protein